MKKTLIIYTGGTIGMAHTPNGYSPNRDVFYAHLQEITELYHQSLPKWDIVETPTIIDSSNMDVNGWNDIAEIIAEHYEQYSGFVVLHGTDTMAYTASALSYMFDGLSKPIILTGSQIPLGELRNDARENLINALCFAADEQLHEVCICFAGKLIRGTRATKYSSKGLIAFSSPNFPTLAEVGIEIKYQTSTYHSDAPFSVTYLQDLPIGVIKVYPGIHLKDYQKLGLKGIVIETFGAGNIPGGGSTLKPLLMDDSEASPIVVVCSQCPEGSVSIGTYETSSEITEVGAVSGGDMTTEAAVTKLYYLMSKGLARNQIKLEMTKNLRGELSS